SVVERSIQFGRLFDPACRCSSKRFWRANLLRLLLSARFLLSFEQVPWKGNHCEHKHTTDFRSQSRTAPCQPLRRRMPANITMGFGIHKLLRWNKDLNGCGLRLLTTHCEEETI